MADDVRVTNWPAGGSHQSVALELWKTLRSDHFDPKRTVDSDIALFGRCLRAVFGKSDLTS